MNKLKVLSIDWDYFIDVDSDYRLFNFPDGLNEEFSPKIRKFVWDSIYERVPSLYSVGILSSHKDIERLVKTDKAPKKLCYFDSHKYIVDVIVNRIIERRGYYTGVEIFNVDFHHDLYSAVDDVFHCGNWAIALRNLLECNDINFKLNWVKREDSDVKSTIYEDGVDKADFVSILPFESLLKEKGFDMIYVCTSGVWSPPHTLQSCTDMVNRMLKNKHVLKGEFQKGKFWQQ